MVEFYTGTMYLNHLDLIGSGQSSRRDFRDIVEHLVKEKIKPLLAKICGLSEIAKAQTDFMKKTLSANRSSRSTKTDFTSADAGRRYKTLI